MSKKAVVAIKNVFVGLDSKFDEACIGLERKVCGGSTVDEKLEAVSSKVSVKVIESGKSTKEKVGGWFKRQPKQTIENDPRYIKALAEATAELAAEKRQPVQKVVKHAVKHTSTPVVTVENKSTRPAGTPFQKCESKPVKKLQKVEPIRTTMYCPFCREVIPVDAHFCPHCRGQIVVPVAVIKPMPINPNAAEKNGLGATLKTPGKESISHKIARFMTADVRTLNIPMANIFSR